MRSQLVVTNHSLLAIDAIEGVPMMPEYDVVVVDEAHELVARVTQAATDELSVLRRRPGRPARPAPRRGQRGRRPRRRRGGAARRASTTAGPAGSTGCPSSSADALVLVRDAARALVSAFPRDPGDDAGATQAKGWAQELFATAERMAAGSDQDVLWVNERERNRGGN